MKFLLYLLLVCWPVIDAKRAARPPSSVCVDCRLVRIACTDELQNERCDCAKKEVCCDNCCGGQTCVPRNGHGRGRPDPCAGIACGIPLCPPGTAIDYDGPGCCPGCKPIELGLCPDGSNPFNCFIDPCQFAICPAYPGATCVSNYCGGCNADWSVNGNPVDCDEGQCPPLSRRPCVEGSPDDIPRCYSDRDCKGGKKCCPGVCRRICQDPIYADCSVVDCLFPVCPKSDSYVPKGQCCPVCREIDCSLVRCLNPVCFDGTESYIPDGECCRQCREVTQKRVSGSCPDGSNPVSCVVNPCQSATCPAYSGATCNANYCGGCNTDWYVNGEQVDCNAEF